MTAVNRTMRGLDITPHTFPAHQYFEGIRPYRTIGIGDGGNEIGMGKIPREVIADNIPNGEQVACQTATDHLIVCGISNWGGYALAAGLVQPLSIASLPTLADGGFLTPRQSLNVAEPANVHLLDALEARFAGTGAKLRRLDHAGVKARVPRAKPVLVAGVLEEICSDIDVGGLLNQYIASFRRGGGAVETGFRVASVSRDGDHWRLSDGKRDLAARTIVNAAGAWADPVAAMAGAAPLGISPKRRTIVQVRVASDDVPADLPLTIDIAGTFYFKARGSQSALALPA